MNIETSPALLANLRRYAEGFAGHLPPIFAYFPAGEDARVVGGTADPDAADGGAPAFPFAPDSDKGLGVLLLCASLYRPGGEAEAARVIAGLYRARGNDLFRLNRAPFEPLRVEVEALLPAADPEERARVPGILRSVCDFFFRTGPLTLWLASAPDWESCAEDISREIYWMGARSRTRAKARHFLWLVCMVPGLGARPEYRAQARAFAWPVSDGHMRFWFDIVKPARGVARVPAPEARLAAFAELARAVFPEEPWRVVAPLDAFLRREARSFVCRAVQGSCRECALSAACPAARDFE